MSPKSRPRRAACLACAPARRRRWPRGRRDAPKRIVALTPVHRQHARGARREAGRDRRSARRARDASTARSRASAAAALPPERAEHGAAREPAAGPRALVADLDEGHADDARLDIRVEDPEPRTVARPVRRRRGDRARSSAARAGRRRWSRRMQRERRAARREIREPAARDAGPRRRPHALRLPAEQLGRRRRQRAGGAALTGGRRRAAASRGSPTRSSWREDPDIIIAVPHASAEDIHGIADYLRSTRPGKLTSAAQTTASTSRPTTRCCRPTPTSADDHATSARAT